ncbi:zinc ribbon-containing protein [Shewanella acanthi]|uniref:zinc ribbon-containing protein n=1 Tax=Shewanella acanthi TaxID=2864212 RepID=UPI001C65F85E|nr:zinc ribbon-containing protein [Shewanella acanthi]QYJ79649.1 zinc ribbon-containing protein [Shewanella acanthi]
MNDRSSALLALYQALIDQVKAQFAEDKSLTAKSLFKMVTQGKDYVSLKEQAGEDELALVEQFLKRDIASFLREQNADSLSYSPSVITFENTLWHWLSEITDRSQVEWHELTQDFKHHGYYQSGDIVNQGVMVCTNCGHELSIEFPSVIPDCPECDHDEYTREALTP